jgi:NADH-quinone oxidoreductase subunit C
MASPAPLITNPTGTLEALRAALGAVVLDAVDAVGEVSITVQRDALADVMLQLRDDFAYQQMMEIAGVDYPGRPERFEVVYHLLSVTKNHRLRVRVTANEDTAVPTITHIWPNAGWLEREVYDLYGVVFAGNPDLRRILTDYGFAGHPFRKDFPLTGYVELRYSEEQKRVVYEPVSLAQDFRSFDFMSPWEGAQYVLPGDEKAAAPEAKGAPTPATAEQAKKADAVRAKAPPDTPKTTDSPAKTGAGAATRVAAAKPKARRPRAVKPAAEAPATPARKPRAPRKPKTEG